MKQYRNKETNKIVKATELTKTFRIVWKFGGETIYKFVNKEEFLKQYEEWEK